MEGEESILEDYSRLVNELVAARREMSRLNEALTQKEEFLKSILQIAPSIIYAADIVDEKLIFTNRSLSSELGFPPGDYQEALGIPISLVNSEDREELETLRKGPLSDTVREAHFRVKNAKGAELWYRLREKSLMRPEAPSPRIVIGSIEEINALKLKEASFKSESRRDFLTGLLNRRGFLEAAEERIMRSLGTALILFIDIDHFKEINDRYGHDTGDEVLKSFAKILVGSLRSDDIAARWGGDEFIALLSTAGLQSLDAVRSRLLLNTETFNDQGSRDWKLGISIGHAVLGQDGVSDLDGLIAAADTRMYQLRREKRLETKK